MLLIDVDDGERAQTMDVAGMRVEEEAGLGLLSSKCSCASMFKLKVNKQTIDSRGGVPQPSQRHGHVDHWG